MYIQDGELSTLEDKKKLFDYLTARFIEYENQGLSPKRLIMRAVEYAAIMRLLPDEIGIETDVKTLKEGTMAYLWGAHIVVSVRDEWPPVGSLGIEFDIWQHEQ